MTLRAGSRSCGTGCGPQCGPTPIGEAAILAGRDRDPSRTRTGLELPQKGGSDRRHRPPSDNQIEDLATELGRRVPHGTRPALSEDGSIVAFASCPANCTGTPSQVFVHDRTTGMTSLVSAAPDGTPGDGGSYHPSISSDGTIVAFQSQAFNLLPYERIGGFVHDRTTGTTSLVSVAADGAPAGTVSNVVVSPDGNVVVYMSPASHLYPATPTTIGMCSLRRWPKCGGGQCGCHM